MAPTWLLRTSLWLPRPIDVVFPFFADAANLEAITPPWLRFSILTPPPIHMAAGTVIDYRLRIRGVPVRWRSRIAEWDPPRSFADEQVRGPYARWYHRHTFEAKDGGTLVGDEVEFAPPGGPLAPLLFRLLVDKDVRRIFFHRTRALTNRFGGDPGACTLEISRRS
ncbi:MAG: SRPBCC family protein [Planctomycetota bacterium]